MPRPRAAAMRTPASRKVRITTFPQNNHAGRGALVPRVRGLPTSQSMARRAGGLLQQFSDVTPTSAWQARYVARSLPMGKTDVAQQQGPGQAVARRQIRGLP